MASDGHKIVAVSDSSGAVYCAKGLDLDLLLAAKEQGKSVVSTAGNKGHEAISADELVAVDCDVLAPSAMENMIHVDNAASIQTKLIVELANGPVTPEADKILEEKGVIILPDILANAGGVTVSYFEWVQNRQGYYWTLEEIHERLKTIMEREGRAIWNHAKQHKVTVRSAAYVHALERLAQAIEAHGTQNYFSA